MMEKKSRRSERGRHRPGWSEAAFRARVTHWAEKIGVRPTAIHLRAMRHKWASCSSRGRITFDTGLLHQARAFGDYVIVHELLHLRVPNHGKLFKSLLSALLPGWEKFER
jgi:predicted metal-dependent hydrolase